MRGTAGGSALDAYRSARRRRRRLRAAGSGVGLALGGAGVILAAAAARPAVQLAGAVVAVASALGTVLIWRADPDIDRWRRGAAAERATARMLDALPARRWGVWHDLRVPGSRTNIDHVVIGRTGVWVVDTKSTRLPVRAGWGAVRFGDRRLSAQATRWEAEVVGERLGVPVRPLIAVHGVGLRRRGGRADGVRVVRADRLVRHLRRGRRRLDRREVWVAVERLDSIFVSRQRGTTADV